MGREIPVTYNDALDSLVSEGDNPQEVSELVIAKIRAIAHVNSPTSVLSEIGDHLENGRISEEQADQLNSEIVQLVLDSPVQADFVKFALSDSGYSSMDVMDEDTLLKIATRLLDAEMPETAQRYLANVQLPYSDAAKLIFGQILILEGQSQMAIATLEGIAGDDAQILRAEALAQMGQLASASEIYDQLGLSNQAIPLRIRAADWQNASGVGESEFVTAPAIDSLLTSSVPEFAQLDLEYSADLLEFSGNTRENIESILE